MVLTENETKIELAQWSKAIGDDLAQDSTPEQLDYWYEQVAIGKAYCFEIFKLDERLGSIVVQIEEWNDGKKELHIGPLGGRYAEAFEAVTPYMYDLAERFGVDRVRVNARREAVEKMLEPHGFQRDYIALVKNMRT